jgi:hypothetical protein
LGRAAVLLSSLSQNGTRCEIYPRFVGF